MTQRVFLRSVTVALLLVTASLLVPWARAAGTHQTATTIAEATTAKFGTILTDSSGHSLYILSSEVNGTIKCSAGCLSVWPPLTVASGTTPTMPSDLTGTLATITRPDGTIQVTYNGFPLYRFVRDTAAGDVNGNGIVALGGEWFVAQPHAAPLSALAAGSGSIRISSARGLALGVVTASYRLNGARLTSRCGSTSCSFSAPLGRSIHLRQHPAPGARFSGWKVSANGATIGSSSSRSLSVRMVAGLRVRAVFVK